MRNTKLSRFLYSLGALVLAGCATPNSQPGTTPEALANHLSALSPTVDVGEARRAAHCAYDTAARLKREYNHSGAPAWHNLLIFGGVRKKGYCFHWTEDLLAALQPLQLKTLDIHWAIGDPGKDTESNALVLTAKGAPLQNGIVLDAWRFGGRLFWKAANADRSYRWEEDQSAYARARLAGQRPR